MQNLIFEEGKTYVDREGNKYIFVDRRGGTTVFKNIDTGKHAVQNTNGQ